MRFVPSTEPPRLAQLMLAAVTGRRDRRYLLSDLQEEYDERVRRDGTAMARRWYRWQARRSLGPLLKQRLRLHRSRFGDQATEVPVDWRPEVAVPTGPFNRAPDMNDFLSDIRVALRSLKKKPQVLWVTVLSLALGIGAVTAVFSVADAFLFRSGSASPEDLVVVYNSEDDGEAYGVLSFPDYLDVAERIDAFTQATAFRIGLVNIASPGVAARTLTVELVTGSYFDVLGIRPALGRGFTAEETRIGSAERVIVISHNYWSRHLGKDPEVLGRSVDIDGHPFTIIGVAPEGTVSRLLGLRIEAWLPLGTPGGLYRATAEELANRGDREFRVLARLQPTSSLAQARAQLNGLAEALLEQYPDTWVDSQGQPRTLTAVPDRQSAFVGDFGTGLAFLSGLMLLISGAILALACSNAASLFLARAHERRREMAVRLAIGSSRRRLVTMLLVESLLPALAAGVLGFYLARLGISAVDTVTLPIGADISFAFRVDQRAFAVTVAVSVLTSLIFGLVPALEGARTDLVSGLKTDTTGRQGRLGLRRILVIGQIAASLIFLLGAGLGLRGVAAAAELDPGFEVDGTALMSRSLRPNRFSRETGLAYLEQEAERLLRLPEISDVQWSTTAELSFLSDINAHTVRLPDAEEGLTVPSNAVTPGYFEMRGIRLLRGRRLGVEDVPGAPEVAVINQAFASRIWPEGEALGRSFVLERSRAAGVGGPARQTFVVVGIAADGLYSEHESRDRPYFWTSLAQTYDWRLILHVAGPVETETLVGVLRREVELFVDEVALVVPTTYSRIVDFRLQSPRLVAQALTGGGLFGLLLATLGIYGLLSFMAVLRSREMAVRQALGADRRQVVAALVGDGLKLSICGVTLGLAVGLLLAHLARGVLYGISPVDPIAVGGSCLLLLGAAFAASLIPARRLAAESPVGRLRGD